MTEPSDTPEVPWRERLKWRIKLMVTVYQTLRAIGWPFPLRVIATVIAVCKRY